MLFESNVKIVSEGMRLSMSFKEQTNLKYSSKQKHKYPKVVSLNPIVSIAINLAFD
jgi:hypothetical protein